MSIFKHLNIDELDQIDMYKACQFFRKGDFLYKENTYPNGLYCISSGRVKLVNSGENGREHILKIIQAGDVTGENAIFSNNPYHNSAVAIEDTYVCFIPKDSFMHMLKKSPMLTLDVLQSMAQTVENSQEKQKDLAQRTVKERLANALLYFKNTYGENMEQYLNIKLSREEIADFIGTSTETVIRLLSDWSGENIISLNKKQIRINSVKDLNVLAGA